MSVFIIAIVVGVIVGCILAVVVESSKGGK